MSSRAAREAAKKGYRNVAHMEAGIVGWTDAGHASVPFKGS